MITAARLLPRQLFGCGSVAQTVLSRNTLGEPLTVHIGFSVGLMMAAYVAGGVSGNISHSFSCFNVSLWCRQGHRMAQVAFVPIEKFFQSSLLAEGDNILEGGFKQRAKCSLFCGSISCCLCVASPLHCWTGLKNTDLQPCATWTVKPCSLFRPAAV